MHSNTGPHLSREIKVDCLEWGGITSLNCSRVSQSVHCLHCDILYCCVRTENKVRATPCVTFYLSLTRDQEVHSKRKIQNLRSFLPEKITLQWTLTYLTATRADYSQMSETAMYVSHQRLFGCASHC